MKAIWNGTVLAESDDTIVVEGNYYFPRQALKDEYFQPSETHSTCPWKGQVSYYDVVVGGAALSVLHVLGQLRSLIHYPIPLVWSPEFREKVDVIEVYPAAMLAAWGHGKDGYKKSRQIAARQRIAERFRDPRPGSAT